MRGVGRAKMPLVNQVATRSVALNVVLDAVWPLRSSMRLSFEVQHDARRP